MRRGTRRSGYGFARAASSTAHGRDQSAHVAVEDQGSLLRTRAEGENRPRRGTASGVSAPGGACIFEARRPPA